MGYAVGILLCSCHYAEAFGGRAAYVYVCCYFVSAHVVPDLFFHLCVPVIFWEFSQGRGFISVKDAETIFHSILNAQGKVFVADAFRQKLPSIVNKPVAADLKLSIEQLKQLYLAQSLYL